MACKSCEERGKRITRWLLRKLGVTALAHQYLLLRREQESLQQKLIEIEEKIKSLENRSSGPYLH